MSNETIKLTAMINNNKYEVSYDIDQVKNVYDKLGISSAAPAASATSTAVETTTPAASTSAQVAVSPVEAAAAINTGTKMDNTVKKNDTSWPSSNLEDHKKSMKLVEDIFKN